MDEPLLRVEHLCQYFGTNKAVDDVSFDIQKGEVFGLVGESGCGKTTTGRSIIRIYDITSGSIYFNGHRIAAGTKSYKDAISDAKKAMRGADAQRKAELEQVVRENRKNIRLARRDHTQCDKLCRPYLKQEVEARYEALISAAPPDRRDQLIRERDYDLRVAEKQRYITKIQMIFQDPIASLDPRMTVYDTIAEGLIIRGEKDKAVIDEKVYRILERVGLVREHATRYPHEFSGGQRQRIGVARAVIMNPDLIIADEPVSALDVSIQAQVINLLNELRHDLGLTVLFIAHDLSVVKYFSDRIGVMYFGRLVELATSDELFAHPLHPYTRSLLSAIPLPDPYFERTRKRLKYDPLAEHNYGSEQPIMREVVPGHFVQCSQAEYERYIKQMQGVQA
ncbi:MAG: ATP-binding cassette domain-containing protein [Clostridia bacterium]|nr:ATP-binding cassette domain-containing protein [Clostridia bacterium]